jgi:hypothetical protein
MHAECARQERQDMADEEARRLLLLHNAAEDLLKAAKEARNWVSGFPCRTEADRHERDKVVARVTAAIDRAEGRLG